MLMFNCPCQSGRLFADCCERFLKGREQPSSPEALMRSRYSAFTLNNLDYIVATMQDPALDNFHTAAHSLPAAPTKWIKLEIKNTTVTHTEGYVEFMAYYSEEHAIYCLHENSQFKRIDGVWFYTDGKQFPTKRINIGRNDNCLCGSLKKFKKCCG